jgi:metal-responsive CopG/Arc/MetJ family transcriptional regulator
MRTAVKPRKWTTIQLPEDLVKNVDEIISTEGLGYTSRSEFVKESVRLRIQEVKKTPSEIGTQ